MVIPMGGMGPTLRGPVPAECARSVLRVKATVVCMIGCTLGRLLTAAFQRRLPHELMQTLNPLMTIIMSIFILKDEQHFSAAYNFLATSLCSQCHEQGMGGLACLMPFAMVCALNFVMDFLFQMGAVLDPGLMPYGIFVGGSIVSEGAAGYFAWKMYTMVRDAGLGTSPDVEMGNGGLAGMQGGFLGGFGGAARSPGYAPAPGEGDSSAAAAPEAPAGFQPFAGSGQRLGS